MAFLFLFLCVYILVAYPTLNILPNHFILNDCIYHLSFFTRLFYTTQLVYGLMYFHA